MHFISKTMLKIPSGHVMDSLMNTSQASLKLLSSSPGLMCFLATLAIYTYWKICDILAGSKHVANLGLSVQRDALAALTSVFTPTKAAWLHHYQGLFSNVSVLDSMKQINVDASQLFKNLVDGTLEMRSTEDISLLLQGKLLVYGWKVQLVFSKKWQMVILGWIFGQYMRVIHIFQSPYTFKEVDSTRIDMDHLPYDEKENVINRVANLWPGDSIVLEFTSMSNHVKWPSQRFIGCAVPFLPSNKRICSQLHPERFSTLLYHLQDYMDLLTQQGVSISNLANISATRRKSLEQRAEAFTANRQWRNTYIEHHNMACWRATRLKLLWEAGLLATGFITRWRVTVTKEVPQ